MMHTAPHLTHVAYNAATQCFEALAVFVENGTRRTIPVEVNAPLSVDFDRARALLLNAALKSQDGKPALSSTVFADTVASRVVQFVNSHKRRGLPVGEFGFFRGRKRAA